MKKPADLCATAEDKRDLWAMSAIALLVFYGNYMVALLIPAFSREFGITPSRLGLVGSRILACLRHGNACIRGSFGPPWQTASPEGAPAAGRCDDRDALVGRKCWRANCLANFVWRGVWRHRHSFVRRIRSHAPVDVQHRHVARSGAPGPDHSACHVDEIPRDGRWSTYFRTADANQL
jgi:hypothetical protein